MNQKIQTLLSLLKRKWVIRTINDICYYLFIGSKPRKVLSYRYLRWEGIEIGGLHNPCPVNTSVTKVRYVDYLDEETIKNSYTELAETTLQKVDFVCKADNLDKITDNSQDFIIGNHLFEHLENPIKTLIEWHRVLKNGGIILMAVPDKRRTFDINRERTTLEHIVLDYVDPSLDRDYEHYLEFAGITLTESEDVQQEAMKLKETNYSIHYHVFIEEDVQNIIDWCNENTNAKFEVVEIKHTSKNTADNEFIFVLRAIK